MQKKTLRLLCTTTLLASVMFTGCTSFYGEALDAPYLVLTYVGALLGYTLSDFIWATDDAGHPYTPWWEVIAWFSFTILGALLAYVKRFFLFSGFLIAVALPIVGMTIVMLIVRLIRKRVHM